MNFEKLQAMQKELDNAILSEKAEMTVEERFNKTLVALSVEVSEIANCSEHFKFWKDNKGKVDEKRFYECKSPFSSDIYYFDRLGNNNEKLTRQQAHKLTLVEECSDALHFILSLANQLDYEIERIGIHFSKEDDDSSKEENLLFLNYSIGNLGESEVNLEMLIDVFFIYISQLGITAEELEQAYYDKNEINYKRLSEGY